MAFYFLVFKEILLIGAVGYVGNNDHTIFYLIRLKIRLKIS